MFNGYVSVIRFEGELKEDLYLKKIPAVKHLIKMRKLELSKNVSIFVGENGTGKSTLLEAIAVAFGFNAEGGTVNFNFSTNNTHSSLYKNLRIGKKSYPKDGFFLRAESIYNVASNLESLYRNEFAHGAETPYGSVSLHEQSHGESFMSIITKRFSGQGLYILDEPEAALSPMRMLELMAVMNELVKDGSQFIISTHSPILMAFPDADVFELSKNGIEKVRYDETEHFTLTKQFLENPDRMFKYLFE